MKAVLRALSRNRIIRKRLPADMGGGLLFCSSRRAALDVEAGLARARGAIVRVGTSPFVKPGARRLGCRSQPGIVHFCRCCDVRAVRRMSWHSSPTPFLAGLMYRSEAGSTGRDARRYSARCTERQVGDHHILPWQQRNGRSFTWLPWQATLITGGDREGLAVDSNNHPRSGHRTTLPRPDLKDRRIDGAELDGARSFPGPLPPASTGSLRPRWIIEVAVSENVKPVGQILRAARYRTFDADRPETEVEWPAWNTLAVPGRKM